MALTKFNFNSFDLTTAASTGIAFNASANGLTTAAAGAMTLIATNTISSGVSSSSFTSGIDSTYDTYMFKFINIHGATDGSEFTVNFRDGSSAFDATKTTTSFYYYHAENDSEAGGSYKADGDLAQGTGYQRLMDGSVSGADNDQSLCGDLFLFSPSSTTFVKHFIAKTNSAMNWDASGNYFVAGYCNVTAAIDGVDFKFSSGNIDSGVIKMYGLSK
jgi:hypothetical protein|tara:strand:+ start:118 stop:768 length:651 start_codon:yes stop_codon:yes gene_type:complete